MKVALRRLLRHLVPIFSLNLLAFPAQMPTTAGLIRSVRVDRADSGAGPLFVLFDGKDIKVADEALKAWIIDGGRQLVFSGKDGAGGYEGEGQSLRLYNPRTGKLRKILSEYFAIDEVQEATTSIGKNALIILMHDGGLGASHLAVVDPGRGEVFAISKAKLLRKAGDMILVGFFRDEDWEAMIKGKSIEPYRTGRYNLNQLLKHPLMFRRSAP